jgi:uncharacterized repeat protein (TIGR03803 family)
VFSVTSAGAFTSVYSMGCFSGGNPNGEIVQGKDGNFYGTDYGWGKFSWGTIYKLTPQGVFTDLHDFIGNPDGGGPNTGLTLGTDGNFYGTTSVGTGQATNGTIFRVSPQGSVSVLDAFNGTDGANPYGGLLQHTNGVLYGATVNGGAGAHCAGGCGTIYKLNAGLRPYILLLPTSGKVGSTVEILGQGFSGATSVSFNGTTASFKVTNATYLTCKVPTGAKRGFVTVKTPNGTLTSKQEFIVQ